MALQSELTFAVDVVDLRIPLPQVEAVNQSGQLQHRLVVAEAILDVSISAAIVEEVVDGLGRCHDTSVDRRSRHRYRS